MTWRRLLGGAAVLALLVAILMLARLNAPRRAPAVGAAERQRTAACSQVMRAWRSHQSGIWLTLAAPVESVLRDTSGRFLHQRFVVRCSSGATILIVNDVSVGQRVPVRTGDVFVVRGQYVWNDLGGLVHFTHHSDAGVAGWIADRNRVYAWTSFRTKSWKRSRSRAAFVDAAAEREQVAGA